MKSRIKTPFLLISRLTALSLVAHAGTALGGTGSSASGDWSNAATWNNGAPINDSSVGIVNGATVTFQEGDTWSTSAWPQTLQIGTSGDPWGGFSGSGTGILNITGGTLSSGYTGIGYNQAAR